MAAIIPAKRIGLNPTRRGKGLIAGRKSSLRSDFDSDGFKIERMAADLEALEPRFWGQERTQAVNRAIVQIWCRGPQAR